MRGASGAAEALLAGWSLSRIASVTSGTPVTLKINDRINWENGLTDGSPPISNSSGGETPPPQRAAS